MNNREFKQKAVRHGELMIVPIKEIPADAPQIFEGKEFIVGHSETGHHHVAIGNVAAFGAGEKLFLRVAQNSVIEHRKTSEKHETKTLFAGLYQVIIKQQYDYFAKAISRVRD